MKKVLIIGASSGIGRELALQYASLGYQVIAIARRLDKLKEIASENISYDFIDINKVEDAILKIKHLIINTDISIICAGIGDLNDSLDFNIEYETIKTNIIGFTAIVDTIFNYYKSIKKGHIVALSSIASIRGSDIAPAYNASKAYVTNYMEGLKKKSVKENLNINITTILPGLVDTQMAKGKGLFWVEPVNVIAKEIISAIEKKKTKHIVSKRWNIIALFLKLLPSKIYYKL
jgi:short-subunit dehydrogenase